MLDFVRISEKSPKKGEICVYPKFLIKKSSDLMIRGGDFYAVWVQERNIWSLDEHDAIDIIDRMIDEYVKMHESEYAKLEIHKLYMWDASSKMIDEWHKYCQRQRRDSYHILDRKLVFSNMQTLKEDYITKKLTYPLEKGDITAYEKLMSVIYAPDERQKIEWAIGAVVTGDSVNIQKFLVLYGAAGTGKSTILNIIQKLFDGYYSVFDAKALGSSNNSFALESFKTNPLVAIQHDGDLSRIEDNTRLNSLVSHEVMTVNEKYTKIYSNASGCFLFMGTNKPVKITDAKSGLIRRLIDVSPSGDKLPAKEYQSAVAQIDFELGAIAYHCKDVYLANKSKYDDYIPTTMLGASNDFYNYIEDSYFVFKEENGITMKSAWEKYKTYCDEAKVQYPMPQRAFKEELRNYFREYKERYVLEDGTRVRSYFEGFRYEKFEQTQEYEDVPDEPDSATIIFDGVKSAFDEKYADCLAQYSSEKGSPILKWDNVTTKLSSLNTSKLHWVRVPSNHIVIDFDLTDDTGEKSLEKNLIEASKWPETYSEVSKSGKGIHLHYIYTGDASKLSRIYSEHIEIKVSVGNGSLRRKLSKFNNRPINTISSGLPLKGVDKMLNFEAVKSEKGLRTLILRNVNKEIHPATKPSIDFIYKILEDAYASDLTYDVSSLYNYVFAFAASSTNQAEYCMDLVSDMKFKSENKVEAEYKDVLAMADNSKTPEDDSLIFYDVEVFPNLFVVCWKPLGDNKQVVKMINPSPEEIEKLVRFKLVGFNCRRYDNHILYGRILGYTNKQLYELSQKIIRNKPNCFFGAAYNISYTDVHDFSAKKQSLKKWEIELGIHHQELGLPWDANVDEKLWPKVADYCCNDVVATEKTFIARKSDFMARQILADITGMTVNDMTNAMSGRLIFGNDRNPQKSFNYRDLGKVDDTCSSVVMTKKGVLFDNFANDEFVLFNDKGQPVFPGYKYEFGKSTYRGEIVGEGGYVYSEPGIYGDVGLDDVASMHPISAEEENLLGDVYTQRFKEVVDARLAIKHRDIDTAKTLLNGALAKYLDDESLLDDLAYALKIVINSVYGLTSASFPNLFKDPRNVDNIVAKRGALFMINLKHAVQDRGFTVAHIKTDSIKIPDATPEILKFVSDFGEMYGYTFEHEATYDRMCLANDAVYIARYASQEKCEDLYGYIPKDNKKHPYEWTATGTQFAVPYVFKTLFTKEDIEFSDLCETKAVQSALYLDYNESLPDVAGYEKEKEKICKKLLSDDPSISNIEVAELEYRLNELESLIAEGHDYKFIGKVGLFSPISDGNGGGLLLRETTTAKKYAAATGSKGHRWLESESIKDLDYNKYIDFTFYDNLANEAADTIAKFGDLEWFVSGEPYLKN